MIITPIGLPLPSPSSSDCAILLSYTSAVIRELGFTLSKLHEVSSSPDEAMLLIRGKIEAMLSEAETMQINLNSIKAEAANKTILDNQISPIA